MSMNCGCGIVAPNRPTIIPRIMDTKWPPVIIQDPGIITENSPLPWILQHTPVIASDGPETGGFGGNIRPDKPIPGACEERPTMTDPITGEEIYVSEWLKNRPGICYFA